MEYLKKLFRSLHVCKFSKPIVSMYVSFHTRNIVYECRCGKRKIINVYRSFGDAFPIETTNFITDKEFRDIANGGPINKQ